MVDDNPDNLGVVAGYLKAEGYKVSVAPNGRIALERVERIRPVLILLDIKLPGIDGFEVCRELKKSADTSGIPVIFITALNDIDNIAKGFRIGGTDYLTKPVNKEELLARVSTHIENYLYTNYLEHEVRLRTIKIEEKANHLYEVNQALKALIDNREVEKRTIEQNLLVKLKRLVSPCLESLGKCNIDEEAKALLNVVNTHLKNIIDNQSETLFSKYLDLTPMEIRVADFVQNGKRTKEIAQLLNLSPTSIEWHRKNIREKFGITNKKINLQTYLKSLVK